MKSKISKLLIISLVITAFIGIYIILTGNFGGVEAQILATTFTIFSFSITGLCCSTIYNKYKKFSIFGMLSSLITSFWIILTIWLSLGLLLDISWYLKILFTLLTLSYSTAHISLILLINNTNKYVKFVKNGTILLAIICNLLIFNFYYEFINYNDYYMRLLFVIGILVTLGTIITPILNKMYKNKKINDTNNDLK